MQIPLYEFQCENSIVCKLYCMSFNAQIPLGDFHYANSIMYKFYRANVQVLLCHRVSSNVQILLCEFQCANSIG